MNRRTAGRLALALGAGVGLGLAAPALPVVGETSASVACRSAVVDVQSRLDVAVLGVALQSTDPAVRAQLVALRSRVVSQLSQVCASVPPLGNLSSPGGSSATSP
jgi:hypothetical protein